MSNIGYREIFDTSPLSIKQLNDTLRALWSKVMGHIEERDLDKAVISRIESTVDAETLETRMTQITQTAQEIALEAGREATDALSGQVEENTARLSVQAEEIQSRVTKTEFDELTGEVTQVQSVVSQQADQISQKVSQNDFDDFAETVLTKDSFEVNIDGENQLHVGADGVSAQSVTAPNVAAAYDGPDEITVDPAFTDAWIEYQEGKAVRNLQQALDKINGKRLTYNVSITMDNTSHYEKVDIHGICGSGTLEILGNGASFYGGIAASYCTAKVVVMGTGMTVYAGSGRAVEVNGCGFFRVDGANFSGSGTDGVYFSEGSRGFLWNCDFAGFTNAAHASMTAMLLINNCTGSGKLKASYGGVISVNGTMPSGGSTTTGNGQVWSTGATGTSGSTTASTSTITAKEYEAATTATCRGSSSWMSGQLRQNFYQGLGACKACIWFDNTTLRSDLSGKTVKSATLKLKRVSGSGRSGAVSVTAKGLTLSSASGTVSNDTSASVYGGQSSMLGTIANGETVAFALPTAMVNALVSGTIQGFALYAGETSQEGTRGFSKNYCRFDAVGDESAPVLTINYM